MTILCKKQCQAEISCLTAPAAGVRHAAPQRDAKAVLLPSSGCGVFFFALAPRHFVLMGTECAEKTPPASGGDRCATVIAKISGGVDRRPTRPANLVREVRQFGTQENLASRSACGQEHRRGTLRWTSDGLGASPFRITFADGLSPLIRRNRTVHPPPLTAIALSRGFRHTCVARYFPAKCRLGSSPAGAGSAGIEPDSSGGMDYPLTATAKSRTRGDLQDPGADGPGS